MFARVKKIIDSLHIVILKSETGQFKMRLRDDSALRHLLTHLQTLSPDDEEGVRLAECHLLIAVTQTFHNNLTHEALAILFPGGLQIGTDPLGLLKPFISLHHAELLDLDIVERLMQFPPDEFELNTDILRVLEDEHLSREVFFMVFSDENMDYSFQLQANNADRDDNAEFIPTTLALNEIFIRLNQHLPVEKFQLLAQNPVKCVALYKFISEIEDEALSHPEIVLAINDEIENFDKVLLFRQIVDAYTDDENFFQDETYIDYIVALIRCAKYRNDIGAAMHYYQQRDLLTQLRFNHLCLFMLLTNGLAHKLVFHMSNQDEVELLTADNIDELPRLMPFIMEVNAAFALLDRRKRLTQALFDQIVEHPEDALDIAIGDIKIKKVRASLPLIKVFNPQAAITLASYLNLGTGMRYCYIPIYRNRNQVNPLFFQLAPEVLEPIMLHTVTPGSLSPITIKKAMRQAMCLAYPEKKDEAPPSAERKF